MNYRTTILAASALSTLVLLITLTFAPAQAERIKDVSSFEGDRSLPLVGYGLVVGLLGTGDGSGARFTTESLVAMLENVGITVDPNSIRAKNVAAVMVTSELPRWATSDTPVDVGVASIGDATSLEGGTLIMTPLKGADGVVYCYAQGSVSIGGFNVEGGGNNRIQKNHANVGVVPSGGRVVQRQTLPVVGGETVRLSLHHPDRNTARLIAQAVNTRFGAVARPEDAGSVLIAIPPAQRGNTVAFLAEVGTLQTEVDNAAKVVLNEKTGTIVVGGQVVLHEAAVAHGSLTIEIRTRYEVSQPNSFNESGETVVVPAVGVFTDEREAHVLKLPATSTIQDVVDILNGMGATPRDLISILQALKAGGSLQAELVVM